MITHDELVFIMPFARKHSEAFLSPLNDTMVAYDISPSPLRMAAFLAQVAHESGQLNYVRELASGAAYDTGVLAVKLGNTPQDDGDGEKYRGRGLLQVTGHDNYQRCSFALFGDDRLLSKPELLEEPEYACMSAGWFWDVHKLNQLADQQDMRGITKRINGGYNGMDKRLVYYRRALESFGRV